MPTTPYAISGALINSVQGYVNLGVAAAQVGTIQDAQAVAQQSQQSGTQFLTDLSPEQQAAALAFAQQTAAATQTYDAQQAAIAATQASAIKPKRAVSWLLIGGVAVLAIGVTAAVVISRKPKT